MGVFLLSGVLFNVFFKDLKLKRILYAREKFQKPFSVFSVFVIPVFERLRQEEGHELEESLGLLKVSG